MVDGETLDIELKLLILEKDRELLGEEVEEEDVMGCEVVCKVVDCDGFWSEDDADDTTVAPKELPLLEEGPVLKVVEGNVELLDNLCDAEEEAAVVAVVPGSA